jgi:hypothetical protein
VLMTQYFDMLKEIGASSRTNAILIPHSPGNLTTLTEQDRPGVGLGLATPSMVSDESRVMYGPRRESAPSSSGNSGRADASSPTKEAHHG